MKQILKTHPFFDNKKILNVKRFKEQGFNNIHFKVKTPNQNYMLREFKLQGVDRELEFKVQRMAYQLKLAPKGYFLDAPNHIMLSAYVKGKHLFDLKKKALKSLAKMLRKLHTLSIEAKPYDLESAIKVKTKKVKNAFQTLEKEPKEWVLCHHDLNPKNIIFAKKKIQLIDWEFAGMNDRYFDLASVCVEYKLSQKQQRVFLKNYLGKEKPNAKKLKAYKVLYKALCKEWFEKNLK
jgi:thiamine kinase-like enzyme